MLIGFLEDDDVTEIHVGPRCLVLEALVTARNDLDHAIRAAEQILAAQGPATAAMEASLGAQKERRRRRLTWDRGGVLRCT